MATHKEETLQRCLDARHDNQLSILKSEKCGCFCCGNVFSAREVIDWDERDGAVDALCPVCGMAGVIGDSSVKGINKNLLNEVKEYGVTKLDPDFIFNEIRAFCDAYIDNKVNHSLNSESLYFSYGLLLAFQGNDESHLIPALQIISFGGEFVEPSPEMAFSILKRPFFDDNRQAMAMLASLYSLHKGTESEKTQDKHAYEYACKSALLGNLLGRCYLYDFLSQGKGCKKSMTLATSTLFEVLDDATDATRGSRKYNCNELFEYYARLGDDCVDNESPLYRDAVRFYLLADFFAAECHNDFYENARKELAKDLQEAKEKFGSFDAPMMMDEHTFYDTFVDYRHSSLPIEVEKCEYDPTMQTLSITLSPTSEYILLDASSATYRRVYHEEVTFVLNEVILCTLPNHPFSFTFLFFSTDETGNQMNFHYGYGPDNLVGSIHFAKPNDDNEGEDE